jgi:hypothetical protein
VLNAAPAKAVVVASQQTHRPAKLCSMSGKRTAGLTKTAEADTCTECNKQDNGCCEAVCSRASDGACYVLQCCPGKTACTKLSCT